GIGTEQYSMKEAFRNEETVQIFNTPNPDPPAQAPVTLNAGQIPQLDSTMKAINKKHISRSKNTTEGGSLIVVNAANSVTELFGEGSVELQTFTDMNGDGYPDLMYSDAMQSSNSMGGLNNVGYNFSPGYITDSYSHYKMNSAGFSFIAFSASGRGSVFGSKPTSTQADNSMSWSGSSSVSSGYNEYYDSHDYGKKFWADINGDGLPDRIERDDAGVTKFRLNTGKQLS